MLFENASEQDRRGAKLIQADEALKMVRMTIERGDIHQVFYSPDGQRLFELCNCCTCCCKPLREEKQKGDNFAKQLQSGYMAVTDHDRCIGCGNCIESCFFDARQLAGDQLILVDELCFGCGSCMSHCAEGAIGLELIPERGIPIPGFQL